MKIQRFFAWIVGIASISIGCLASFAAVSMNEGAELCAVFVNEGRKVDPYSCELSALAIFKTFSLYVGVALFYGLLFYISVMAITLFLRGIFQRMTKKQ